MIEIYVSRRHGPTVVAFHAKTIQFQWERNPPEEVGHKDQAAIQDRQHGQIISSIILGNLNGQAIKSRSDLVLTIQHSLKVTLHRFFKPSTIHPGRSYSGFTVQCGTVHELPRY